MAYQIVLHVAFHVLLSIVYTKPIFSIFDMQKIMSVLFHACVCVSKLKFIFLKFYFKRVLCILSILT